MEFDSIKPWSGGDKKVVIRPSAENGMFIIQGHGAIAVSDRLCLTGLPREELLDIEGGDLESIAEYLRQDPNVPSVFRADHTVYPADDPASVNEYINVSQASGRVAYRKIIEVVLYDPRTQTTVDLPDQVH